MSEIIRIIDQFEREHDGDPWHGSPLSAILDAVTAADAALRPLPGSHSIWELVLHMTSWKKEVRRRLSGGAAALPEDGEWPDVGDPTEKCWAAAKSRLDDAHRQLMTDIRATPESRLYEPTNDPRDLQTGAGVTFYQLLHGLVQHDVYHSGQIALLAKR